MSEDTNPPLENAVGTPPSSKQPRRPRFSEQQLATLSHEDFSKSWQELDMYIDFMESQLSAVEGELVVAREAEERFRQQHLESVHREKVLVRRLATKEQETQEYVSQISELKAAQAPGAAALRSALLDPAVNLCLQRLAQQLAASRAKVEETQNELSAWKFTPDSNTGKRLMAKCRLLYQENEDLGRMVSSGRLAKLEGELALQKSFSEEVKKSQSELDEFLQELDEDVEGMQSTIYYLQQELRKSKEMVAALQAEISALRSVGATPLAPVIADIKQEKVEAAELDCKVESPPAQEAVADPAPSTMEDRDQPADGWKDVKPATSPIPSITIKTDPEDEDSSGSAELILKVEADELGPEAEFEAEAGQEVQPVPEIGEGKKRLFVNDDSSGDDSDNVPLIKKVRRDSELSLHYNEDEDEDEATRLINVNSAGQNNVQE